MNPQTPNPSETTPVAPPVSSDPQKKDSHGITVASMAIFILLALGAVAFLYYQNQQLKSMLASYQTQPSPVPIATTDPTANWKTYTSTAIGISFKYPQDWNPPKEGVVKNRTEINFEDKIIIAYQEALTLKDFVDENLPTDDTPAVDYLNGDIIGKKLIYRSGVDRTIIDTVIAFPWQQQSLITVSYTDSPGNITNPESIDQIISTFKFLGTVASPSAKPVACTMEAKICPDGSSVGRTGPNCEFAPCPTP